MKKHITAFYLETLLLVVVFVAIILVITQVFGSAKAKSAQAKHLTQAVMLAEDAAEAVSASDSLETVQHFLEENGTAQISGNVLTLWEDEYQVVITWEPEGVLVSSTITVLWNDNEIYNLKTAVYIREALQ